MKFSELGLSTGLLDTLAQLGYDTPTPIQAQAIPVALQGKDILAAAQTGTGKTAAFALPIMERLAPLANNSPSPARHLLKALVITPTRELADQVGESMRDYSKHLPLRCAVVFGGVAIAQQTAQLRAGVEVLVATPGRLMDHMQARNINLSHVDMVILDEADRMLDMGFIQDITTILQQVPQARQTMLFSATFSPEIKKLAERFLRNPTTIEVARSNSVNQQVTQKVHPVELARKRAVLAQLIRSRNLKQVLVFTRTRHAAEKLYRELVRDGFSVAAIHGDKSQSTRMAALADFKSGAIEILVATDVAARGLDITDLPVVVNFELPPNPEDYVHRIGRTGRAGASGEALSLVSPDEQKLLEGIEKLIKTSIPCEELPLHSPIKASAAVSPLVHASPPPAAAPARTSRRAAEPAAARASTLASQPVRPLAFPARPQREVAALLLPPRPRLNAGESA